LQTNDTDAKNGSLAEAAQLGDWQLSNRLAREKQLLESQPAARASVNGSLPAAQAGDPRYAVLRRPSPAPDADADLHPDTDRGQDSPPGAATARPFRSFRRSHDQGRRSRSELAKSATATDKQEKPEKDQIRAQLEVPQRPMKQPGDTAAYEDLPDDGDK